MNRFAGTAFQSGYDACVYVHFCHRERSLKALFSRYKEFRSAEGADGADLSFSAAEALFCEVW